MFEADEPFGIDQRIVHEHADIRVVLCFHNYNQLVFIQITHLTVSILLAVIRQFL